jgi:hypothetical protein
VCTSHVSVEILYNELSEKIDIILYHLPAKLELYMTDEKQSKHEFPNMMSIYALGEKYT